MNIIKVDATNSTSTLIASLFRSGAIEFPSALYTVDQTGGRGRLERPWNSEPGKNLTISYVLPDFGSSPKLVFRAMRQITWSVLEVLEVAGIPDLSVKWPNDIMAGDCKIAGILIERSLRQGKSSFVIVGIGLNVNQVSFNDEFKATSMCRLVHKVFDIDPLAYRLSDSIANHLLQDQEISIDQFYSKLYGFKQRHRWQIGDKIIDATLLGLDEDGSALLYSNEGKTLSFTSEEIRMLRV
jgi:BirA family biotin operon repressor/biotin-[acetyl-CoA-carboxylase] ligase